MRLRLDFAGLLFLRLLGLWLLGSTLSLAHAQAVTAPPLFGAPPRSGAVTVDLRPTEVVRAGESRLVTFGVPFPRGALLTGELGQVRVLGADGAEVPAWVEMLTPWRHPSDAAQDGTSVRVVRIQIMQAFAAAFPASTRITVSWNQGARTLSRPNLVDPRSAWHQVTDTTTATGGPTFGPAHRVFEPDVYALLPKAWLGSSGLKHPTQPFGPTVAETRRDPASMAARYPGFEEADHAQVNFFYTIINDDEVATTRTDNNTNYFADTGPEAYEPWLYDRAMAMYVGYLRGGQFRFLREAVRNADYYRQQLWTPADCNNGNCVGSFKLKNRDAAASWHDEKYSYNESLAFTHWLTGDALPLPHIEQVTRIYAGVPTAVNPSWFTERHTGFKLMANTVAYEVTGKTGYRDVMRTALRDFRNGQTQPYGGVADGGIWHTISGHEGDDSSEPITSPWMSALIVDAAMRAIVIGEAADAVPLIEGLAGHVCGNGSYFSTEALRSQSGGANLRVPHYLATRDGRGWASEVDPFSNVEHAFDTGSIAAWGAYFRARAADTTQANRLALCAAEFYTTFDHLITNWTRPGTPNYDAYRANPHRKYGWWFKNSSGFQWALAPFAGPTPQPVTVALTAPADGARFTAPASFVLTATAAPAERVARVQFWSNGRQLGEDASAPYEYSVSGLAAGSYRFEARAVAQDGAVVNSAAVNVTVDSTPLPTARVTLASPANGSHFTLGTAVTLNAQIEGQVTVTKLDFLVNDAVVLTRNQAPWSGSWKPAAAGSYRVAARATLADGRVITSGQSTVTIDAAPPTGTVFVYRQGLNGYAGVTDVGVSNQYVQWTNGRGVVSNDARTGAYKTSGTDAYEVRTFVRFGGLDVLKGKRVVKAELKLTFEWGDSGYTLNGYYLTQPWNMGSAKFGWTQRNDSDRWSVPGSGGADWLAGKNFVVSGFTGGAADTRKVALDAGVVQGWIDNAAGNNGFVLVATTTGKISWVRSSEDSNAAYRPTLEITVE